MKLVFRVRTVLNALLWLLVSVGPACTPPAEKPAAPTEAKSVAAASPSPNPATPAPAPAAGHAKAPTNEKPKRPLENAKVSEWDLCEEVLRALKAKDRKALQTLRITESEYKTYLFPEFPATRAGTDTNVDFHWDYLNVRSFRGISDALDQFGGMDLELLDIITEGVDEYPSYHLLNKVRLKVRRKPDGEEKVIRVFGSIVELDGQYKLLAFPT
jgi:hypothetical protein